MVGKSVTCWMDQCGPVWLVLEEPERVWGNEMGEADRDGIPQDLGSVRIWVLIAHKQVSLECFKQMSYMIRFVFERVTLKTTKRAD